ncbi:MAG: hypothetical protein NTZ72_04565 [Afipia sp.]|jgi:hypothetical protein|nr:hypothetical protein [Afipia sp.]
MPFILIAIALAGASLVFRQAASALYNGTPWAVELCSYADKLCKQPNYLLYAAGAALVFGFLWKLTASDK